MKFIKQLMMIMMLFAVSQIVFAAPILRIAANNQSFTPEQTKEIEKIVHNYLIQNPKVMVQVFTALQKEQEAQQTKKAEQAISSNIKSMFQSSTSPIAGNANGQVIIVEFFDNQCPHCKAMGPIMDALIKANPELKVVYKELPIFPNSEFIAKAALAANLQGKYSEFHNALLNAGNPMTKEEVMRLANSVGLNVEKLKADMASPQVKSEVDNNQQLAQNLGLMGTPAFVVAANNKRSQAKAIFISGQTSQEELQKLIDKIKHAQANGSK